MFYNVVSPSRWNPQNMIARCVMWICRGAEPFKGKHVSRLFDSFTSKYRKLQPRRRRIQDLQLSSVA